MRGRSLCLHLPDRCSDVVCPSGDTEATAFGGSSSGVAVKENMVMLNKVESEGQYHAERRPLDLGVGN